ncbi:MAG TPA: hypothetical protein IGS40_02830 [Trichormus sp. M33_DOE_039]|nr:hypothetical protein [Trichormus sp. M33_DOE_039]
MYGCFLGNNQRKVSCWEDGYGEKPLKISTAGGIAVPENLVEIAYDDCFLRRYHVFSSQPVQS